MPVNLTVTNVDRKTADILWVVPNYAFGTETYIVQYGLMDDALNMETDLVFSGLDLSVTDQQFWVTIEDLQPFTQYYFRVVATNILTSTSSDIETFKTSKTSYSVCIYH